ncbi:MAG: zf-TFIIB domain-containing protein [Phycisphaerales bacterium]|nr:zf-TFIIB domain-containing protein [Phycisphaerales bacterium]
MRCPNCQVELVSSQRLGVQLDYCPSCHGVWLECGNLNALIERANEDVVEAVHQAEIDCHRHQRISYASKSTTLNLNVYDTTV